MLNLNLIAFGILLLCIPFTIEQKYINFFQAFFPLGKIYYHTFLLENLNTLISWEQIKGANKPVKKTSAKIFLKPGINNKKDPSEKFLNKICKK